MKVTHAPSNISIEFIGFPKKGLIQSKTLMRDLFRLAKNNKLKRVLVVLEK